MLQTALLKDKLGLIFPLKTNKYNKNLKILDVCRFSFSIASSLKPFSPSNLKVKNSTDFYMHSCDISIRNVNLLKFTKLKNSTGSFISSSKT